MRRACLGGKAANQSDLKGLFDFMHPLNQPGKMHGASVWLLARLVEPGSTHANSTPQPGSGETPESTVSVGPSSPGAVVYLNN